MYKILAILGFLVCSILFSPTVMAASPYVSIDVYYNGQLYPGTSTPKPIVKIGEPFSLKFDVTVNQYCKVYAELSDLGTYNSIQSFTVIDGPSDFGKDYEKIYEKNETYTYEWKLKATDEWAGGSMPIDFHYSVLLPGDHESIVNGEFTAAYVTISEEYYDGPVTTAEPAEDESSSPSTPAFTALCAVFALVVAAIYKRK